MPQTPGLSSVERVLTESTKHRWVPLLEMGRGDTSRVFRVTDAEGQTEVAMKVEKLAKNARHVSIQMEVMKALRDEPNAIRGIECFHIGQFQCTVMSLAGADLQVIKDLMHNKFSDSTLIRLAIRTLLSIKSLHEHCYIHRDIEPANFALSPNPNSRSIYLIDFGCARQYAKHDANKWVLRAARERINFRGSMQYCSPRMHDLEEVSRVDDLWSWLFVVFELRATLPWTDSTHPDKYAPRKRRLLEEIMDNHPFLQLFAPIVKMLRGYKYEDRPDYNKMFEIMNEKMREMGVKWSDPMDFDVQARRLQLEKPTGIDEKAEVEQVTNSFREVVVPGGPQYLIPSNRDFMMNEKMGKNSKEAVSNQTRKTSKPSRNKKKNNAKKATASSTSSASRQTPPPSPIVSKEKPVEKKKNLVSVTVKEKCKA